EKVPKPRLTHFIALPIGQHAGLRERMENFTTALLRATPAIAGLDETVVIPARRLHFTLGVMSLDVDDSPERTVEHAKRVLDELRPKILEALGGEALRVRLDRMDIMKPERGDRERANVMWVGPAGEGESGKRLKCVAVDVIVQAFRDAGLVVDEKRELKLHCTVVNTIYRKPRGRKRTPFSYLAVLGSDALKAVLAAEAAGRMDANLKGAAEVEFGEWEVDEVQICEMGSWGPEGEYVAVARCPL
ncbi:kinase A anchor protein, partial [Trametes polyzona]